MVITTVVLWIVALSFIVVTLLNMLKRSIKTRRCTAVTTGTISDVKEKVKRGDGYTTREYHTTVSYSVNGVPYSKPFTKGYNAETYKVGQQVEVLYNPLKPEEINTKGVSNKADLVMLGVGVLIAIIGAVLLAFA